ncbi:MAG: HAD-IA family hydrolase [Phycisphaerae bacterium]|nr:HAD-IA family hydrolase [Phycisphaerae bacterium]
MDNQNIKRNFSHKGILLDFYGTVVEEDDVPITRICSQIAEASSFAATTGIIGEYWGHQFSQLCYESVGDSFKPQKEIELISLRRVLKHFKVKLDPKALSQVLYDYWAQPAIFPENRTVLAQCNVPVCLVSNIDNAELRSALRYNSLSFEFIVTSEDCRAYKPRAEMFEKALETLGMTNEEVLCVGDSLGSDVKGAKAMGMPVLWINRKGRTTPPGNDAPDYVSGDLAGLLNVLGGEINS